MDKPDIHGSEKGTGVKTGVLSPTLSRGYKINELKRSHKYFKICIPQLGVITRSSLQFANPGSSSHAVPYPGTRVPNLHELCNTGASRLFSQSVGNRRMGVQRVGPTFVLPVWETLKLGG
jgi:hypothetical protein